MDAAAHAQRASELLRNVEGRLEAVNDLDEMQRLEMVATGANKVHNMQVKTTLELARGHALTSLALQGLPAGALEATGDYASDAAAVRELAGGGAR